VDDHSDLDKALQEAIFQDSMAPPSRKESGPQQGSRANALPTPLPLPVSGSPNVWSNS